jgi:hypothetical protein
MHLSDYLGDGSWSSLYDDQQDRVEAAQRFIIGIVTKVFMELDTQPSLSSLRLWREGTELRARYRLSDIQISATALMCLLTARDTHVIDMTQARNKDLSMQDSPGAEPESIGDDDFDVPFAQSGSFLF